VLLRSPYLLDVDLLPRHFFIPSESGSCWSGTSIKLIFVFPSPAVSWQAIKSWLGEILWWCLQPNLCVNWQFGFKTYIISPKIQCAYLLASQSTHALFVHVSFPLSALVEARPVTNTPCLTSPQLCPMREVRRGSCCRLVDSAAIEGHLLRLHNVVPKQARGSGKLRLDTPHRRHRQKCLPFHRVSALSAAQLRRSPWSRSYTNMYRSSILAGLVWSIQCLK
jgi:hypothetical protein